MKRTGQAEGLLRIPFDQVAERIILSTSRWLFAASVVMIVYAVLTVAAAFLSTGGGPGVAGAISCASSGIGFGTIPGSIVGLLGVVMALWLILAGRSLQRVATTDATDQQHLIQAITRLRNVFFVKAMLIIAAVALWALLLLMMSGGNGVEPTWGIGVG